MAAKTKRKARDAADAWLLERGVDTESASRRKGSGRRKPRVAGIEIVRTKDGHVHIRDELDRRLDAARKARDDWAANASKGGVTSTPTDGRIQVDPLTLAAAQRLAAIVNTWKTDVEGSMDAGWAVTAELRDAVHRTYQAAFGAPVADFWTRNVVLSIEVAKRAELEGSTRQTPDQILSHVRRGLVAPPAWLTADVVGWIVSRATLAKRGGGRGQLRKLSLDSVKELLVAGRIAVADEIDRDAERAEGVRLKRQLEGIAKRLRAT